MEKLKSKLNYYKEIGCSLNADEVKKILNELENTQANLYEANNRINDLLDIVKQKDKIIDLMANALKFVSINDNNKYIHFNDTESIEKYFEERCK